MRVAPSYGIDCERMARTIAWLIPGPMIRNLRALSFSLQSADLPVRGVVSLRLHHFGAPTPEDLELAKDLEAELYAQTPDEFDYRIEAQTTPIGTSMNLLPHTAWMDGAEQYRRK